MKSCRVLVKYKIVLYLFVIMYLAILPGLVNGFGIVAFKGHFQQLQRILLKMIVISLQNGVRF